MSATGSRGDRDAAPDGDGDGAGGPTARALRVLELLGRHPGITASALGDRLGVTDRAARRYVAVLRAAGVPVDSAPGRYGGYSLGRGVRLPPLVFTGPEALALVTAALAGGGGAGEAVDAALGKLLRALPTEVARRAAEVRESAVPVPDRLPAPDPAVTAELARAVSERRRVRLGYRSGSGTTTAGEVDPWAVVVRHRRWYLLCHALTPDATRAYRLDRVVSVELLATRFTPPADLDAAAHLERHLGSDRPFEVRVVFDAPREQVAPWVSASMGELGAVGADRCLLVGTTSNPDAQAAERLAPVPHPFTVLGGQELRAAVAALAARLSAAVAPPGQPDHTGPPAR